jgi:CRISP-associated protein Cas1
VREGRYFVKNKEQESYIPFQQVRSIMLHTATNLSHEVISVAIQHNTEILFIDRKGFPIGRVWSHHFGSISTIRKNQLAFAQSTAGIDWIKDILVKKGNNQILVIDLLSIILQNDMDVIEAKAKIKASTEKIKNYEIQDHSETFASFRGYEGSMGKVYFQTISSLLPNKYQFNKRSQHPAHDGFNCMLNYAYGMLYGMCESALLKVGIDPHIGIMHRDEYNRPVLVYDFIEQFRHWADYVVCHLCVQEVVDTDFFDVENQQFWLNQTGKRIVIQSFNDYLNEVVVMEGLSRSRLNHIEFIAQKTATFLKTFSPLN